ELLKTFRQLNYKIERHEDLKSHQILEVADTLSKQDHSRYSSMVVCILSHGGLRSVYGVDGFPVPVRNLTEKFTGSNCKSLAGKPKLFFVQACQGSKEQTVQQIRDSCNDDTINHIDICISHRMSEHVLNDCLAIDFSGGFYHMTRPYSGMCVIINNKTFSKESKLLPRRGTEFDEERLSQTFTKLKFKTCIYRDLSAEEIVEKITELAEVDHSKYGACVVCILSHGNETAVFGSYGHSVGINHLTSLLSPRNCQSLTGKPKLLFIQACRGIRDQTIQNNNIGQIEEEQHDIGDTNSDIQYIPPPSDPPLGEPRELGDINSDIQYLPPPPDTALRGPHDIADINGDTQCLPPQPDPPLGEPHSLQGEFDFLLGYATTPGYVSYRDCKQGTVYVRTLTEELMAYSDRLDLLSILTIVTNKLSDMNIDGGAGKVHKQCPMPQFSLTKKLYFFPENFV
ncbi:Hypothetical predicted protein, partial [Mytilus galloprovincialis]